ncbi:MAG: META domain-containing protein [Parabacteroides sp.]|nr:META domain-containing protein [Parabacteroides sp.]
MKSISSIILILASIVILSGCRSQYKTITDINELEGEWNVVELEGKSLPSEKTLPYLSFDLKGKRLSGNAGCNRIIGSLDIDESNREMISFPQVGSTRMACPDMSVEDNLLKLLNSVKYFESQSKGKPVTRISLCDEAKTPVIVLEKK